MFNFFKQQSSSGGWRTASAKDMDLLLDFLSGWEHTAVPFTSRLLNNDKQPDGRMLSKNTVLIRMPEGCITGAVLISPEGIVCPVIPDGSSDPENITGLFRNSGYFRKRYLTLMGDSDTVGSVEKNFSDRNRTSVDYFQYTAVSAEIPGIIRQYLSQKPNTAKILIHKADEESLSRLLPLRKAYEIEEVVLRPENFNEASCRRRFLKTIREETVLYADIQGSPAATCCVNASGIAWSQIGGVYTVPAQRSRGISAALMARLALKTAEEERNLTLFVKTDNTAALRLYSNCGFKKSGNYRISYLVSR